MKNKTKIIAAICIALLPVISHATCVRADVTGTWKVYSITDGYVTRCSVVIPSTGTTLSSSSVCTIPNVAPYTLRGSLNIDATCQVTGSIRIGTRPTEYVNAWISKGKDSISGMAWFPNKPYDGFIFSGSKQ